MERLCRVVRALDEGLARDVVRHGLLGRRKLLVVRAARRRVDEAARDARHEEVVVDEELDGVLDGLLALGEHAVELLGLRDVAREAVEDEAARREGKSQVERLEGGGTCARARGTRA